MSKAKKNKNAQDVGAVGSQISMLAHDLEDLLRTVRKIAHQEDELCALVEAVRKADNDADLLKDLKELLETLSAVNYNREVETLMLRLPGSLLKPSAKRSKSKEKTKKIK